MNWNTSLFDQIAQGVDIKNREEKQIVANKIATRLRNGDVVGVGSGSTSLIAIHSIAQRVFIEKLKIKVIPTSLEIVYACQQLNLLVTDLSIVKPDWCFDGADEVDSNHDLNKGRGGAMFKEKLIMSSCDERYILIDSSKLVPVIGTNFPIPVEILPISISYVQKELLGLGANKVAIRLAGGKDGPVITESGGIILDVHFEDVYDGLEKAIKVIPGVLESGLFQGYKPIILSS